MSISVGLNVFYFDYQTRTFDWRFDKRTQKLHDRNSRYMPVNMLTKLNVILCLYFLEFGSMFSSDFDSQAGAMDLKASGSTWRSNSKSKAKDSCE